MKRKKIFALTLGLVLLIICVALACFLISRGKNKQEAGSGQTQEAISDNSENPIASDDIPGSSEPAQDDPSGQNPATADEEPAEGMDLPAIEVPVDSDNPEKQKNGNDSGSEDDQGKDQKTDSDVNVTDNGAILLPEVP